MSRAPEQPKDPIRWCAALALAFLLGCLPFLTVVTHPYFDEVHYLPAAREFLTLGTFINREHPLVGKELIALGIALFGDNPWGWRLLPTLFGTLALFAAMRAWFESAAGMEAAPARVRPRVSATEVMVEAVPMVMQVPTERAMPPCMPSHSSSETLPARRSSQYFQPSEPLPRMRPL